MVWRENTAGVVAVVNVVCGARRAGAARDVSGGRGDASADRGTRVRTRVRTEGRERGRECGRWGASADGMVRAGTGCASGAGMARAGTGCASGAGMARAGREWLARRGTRVRAVGRERGRWGASGGRECGRWGATGVELAQWGGVKLGVLNECACQLAWGER